jgi:hypothetical protein
MTLLAVREFFNVPVLIGDTLVSEKASGKLRFPTQPPDKLLDSTSTGYLPSDTYRKVYIISDNFAIGWAGDMWLAELLLKRIFSSFAGRVVTQELWEKFITSQHVDIRRNMLLAGWIIESERRLAFRWRSKFPLKLEKNIEGWAGFFDGSGADFARRTLGEPPVYTSTASENKDKATLRSLDGISELIAFELWDGRNLRDLFGLCYELIVFDGNKFSYVDNINYLLYRYTWRADQPNQIVGGIVRFRTYYKNFDGYACCTISNQAFEPYRNGFFVIKPIFGEKSQVDWAPTNHVHQGFDADYFCNFVIVEASDGKNMFSPFIVTKGSPELPIEYTDDGNETYVKMKEGHDFILNYYLNHRAQFNP